MASSGQPGQVPNKSLFLFTPINGRRLDPMIPDHPPPVVPDLCNNGGSSTGMAQDENVAGSGHGTGRPRTDKTGKMQNKQIMQLTWPCLESTKGLCVDNTPEQQGRAACTKNVLHGGTWKGCSGLCRNSTPWRASLSRSHRSSKTRCLSQRIMSTVSDPLNRAYGYTSVLGQCKRAFV